MLMYPKIYAEMHLVFNNNYNVNVISKETGITPYCCQRMFETRINALTQEHHPGFWTVRSDTFTEYDVKIVLDNLISKVKGKLSQIKKICIENNGMVFFDIVPTFLPNGVPAIYFDRDFLDIVDFLNAEIRIDMYIDDE